MAKRILMIGAGGHGQVVAEIAEAVGYNEIAYVDDNHPQAIGKMSDLEELNAAYPQAFVAIGNNQVRHEVLRRLRKIGYDIPTLIHPTSSVSKSSSIGKGTVIEAGAIVNANTVIGEGCIISVGAIVDHNVVIGDCVHVNAGAICKAGGKIEAERRIDAGVVVEGY